MGRYEVYEGDAEDQGAEAAAYHGEYGLGAAVEVAVHAENKGDCQVIVAAGGEKGDAGFYDGGVLGEDGYHSLGGQLCPKPEQGGGCEGKGEAGEEAFSCAFGFPCAVILGGNGGQGVGYGGGGEHGEYVVFACYAYGGGCVDSKAVGDAGEVEEG